MKSDHLVLVVLCGKVFLNLMSGIGYSTFRIDIGENHGPTIWITSTPKLHDISNLRFYQKIDHTVVNPGVNYDDKIGIIQIIFWRRAAIFRRIGYDEPIGVISIAMPDVLSWYIWLEVLMEYLRCNANTIVSAFWPILGVVAIRIEGPRRWEGQPSQISPHWIFIIDRQILISLWHFLSHN